MKTNLFRRGQILTTLLLAFTACVDEYTLPYDGLDVTLDATPVSGEGLRLQAAVANTDAPVTTCGFRYFAAVDKRHYPGAPYYETIPERDVKLEGATRFETLVVPEEEWLTELKGYAYIIVDGKEYRSDAFELTLDASQTPHQTPRVTRVESYNAYADNAPGNVVGRMRIDGEGFYGYIGRDGYPSYVEAISDNPSLKFVLKSITPTKLEFRFSGKDFGNHHLRLRQGEVTIDIADSLRIAATDTLRSPGYPVREGEFLDLHHHNDLNVTSLYVDQLQAAAPTPQATYNAGLDFTHGTIASSSKHWFAFRSGTDRAVYHQFINGCGHPELLDLQMSYPWQQVTRVELPTDRLEAAGYQSVAGSAWWIDNGALHQLDVKTGREATHTLPFTLAEQTTMTLGHDDQSHLLLFQQTGAQGAVYTFDPAVRQFTHITGININSESGWTAEFVGGEGKDVQLVLRSHGHKWYGDHSYWIITYDTEAHALDGNGKSYDTGMPDGAHFTGFYHGKFYITGGWGGYCHTLYSLDPKDWRSIIERHGYLPYDFDHLWEHNVDVSFISGHYLYVGNTPLARYDLDSKQTSIEYLGCPRDAYYDLLPFPDGEDCLAYDRKQHVVYRFAEDR